MVDLAELANLSIEKLTCIDRTLTFILSVDCTIHAFAQIIDGIPTKTSFEQNDKWSLGYMDVNERIEPSFEAVQEYHKIRDGFAAQDLKVPVEVSI